MVSLAKQRQTACFRPHLKSVNHRLSQSTMFRLKVVFLSCPASELAPKRQPNTRTKCQRPSVPTGRHFACSRLKCWATRCLCLNRCSKQCPPTSYTKGNRRPSSSEQGNRRRILAVSPACRKRFSPVSRPYLASRRAVDEDKGGDTSLLRARTARWNEQREAWGRLHRSANVFSLIKLALARVKLNTRTPF